MKRKTVRNILIVFVLALFGGGCLFGFAVMFSFGADLSSKPIILEADFDRLMVEDSNVSPLAQLGFDKRVTLQDTLAALEAATKDSRVKILVARVGNGEMGPAQRQDVRAAIQRFRAAGKKAYAFSETFGEFSSGNGNYYLATAFDKIFLQPSGDIGLTGLRAEPPFVRGTLDKLEVVPRGGQRYEYKNALDFFTETRMTPAYREAIEVLLQSIHRQMMAGIAEGRRIELGKMQEIIDKGPYLAREALEAKLVDELRYRDEVYAMARKEVGRDARLLYLQAYLQKRGNPYKKGNRSIALIYGVGAVQRGESSDNPITGEVIMGSDTVCAAFRAATDDAKIKVILFRVNSPGGSYVASDAILREIARAREKGKKVVVSMGDVAGSGGYLVALAADVVIAEPATITGSIGVLALKLLTQGFWNKLGITYDSAQTARNADFWSSLADWSPEELAKFNAWLDRIYVEFTDLVANGRRMPKERVLEIAKGRVWSGEDALRLGLVDELGGFAHAVERSKQLAGIPVEKTVKLVLFPKPKSLLESLTAKKPENSEKAVFHAFLDAIAPLQPFLRDAKKLSQPAGASVLTTSDPRITP